MDTATRKPVATSDESGDVDLSKSETGSGEDVTGKPVACETAAVKLFAPSISQPGKTKSCKDRLVTQSARVSSHNSSLGNSILDRQGDQRTRTR